MVGLKEDSGFERMSKILSVNSANKLAIWLSYEVCICKSHLKIAFLCFKKFSPA